MSLFPHESNPPRVPVDLPDRDYRLQGLFSESRRSVSHLPRSRGPSLSRIFWVTVGFFLAFATVDAAATIAEAAIKAWFK